MGVCKSKNDKHIERIEDIYVMNIADVNQPKILKICRLISKNICNKS